MQIWYRIYRRAHCIFYYLHLRDTKSLWGLSLYLLLICAALFSSLICGGRLSCSLLSGSGGRRHLLLAIAVGRRVDLGLAARHVHALLVLGAGRVDALPARHLFALYLGAVAAVLLVELAERFFQLIAWLGDEGVRELLFVSGRVLVHLKSILINFEARPGSSVRAQ